VCLYVCVRVCAYVCVCVCVRVCLRLRVRRFLIDYLQVQASCRNLIMRFCV